MTILTLATDSALRRRVQAILQSHPDFPLVGEADSLAAGVALVAMLRPHIVLLGPEQEAQLLRQLDTTVLRLTEPGQPAEGALGVLPLEHLEAGLVPVLQCARLGLVTQPVRPLPSPTSLSAAEDQVLRLLVKGCDSFAIAKEMDVAHTTVKKYVRRLLAKLHVRDRVGVVVEALRRGWVTLEPTPILPR